ncbi:unnamed protein product [Rotaria socialis]|uniref:Uncharacterized protein n=1 Tax=Rotaria socialis TaxID=392032 RepID=A0A820JEQ5_9BILA|nr:unnamed protein product [Rotaria socialis]CAF3359360.1 unnamed protein product [Rotaria socialis]CAF3396973.1 unnamed protein product [Rotaria socialis]CAF3413670.1 unnamed protein product [Rotaria socialis]CAF4189107.1 unnamed protein product [Rotaria socialis]
MNGACKKPNDFPLLGNAVCVPQDALFGIFLGTVIGASVLFLGVIVLLIVFYKRYSISYDARHDNNDGFPLSVVNGNNDDNDGDKGDDENDSIVSIESYIRAHQRISQVLTKIVDTNPSNNSIRPPVHDNVIILQRDRSLSSSESGSSIGLRSLSKPINGKRPQPTKSTSKRSKTANYIMANSMNKADTQSNILSDRF